MNSNVVQLRGVRKPSLVLVKGGRAKAAAPPLTDEERYPRFPPAWVDWLVLGLGLAALNFPSPVPLLSIGAIIFIVYFVARRFAAEGGDDPNRDTGVTSFFSPLFTEFRLRKPLERRLPSISAFTKQVVVFSGCEAVLCIVQYLWVSEATLNFLSMLLFTVVTLIGLWVLMWWDAPEVDPKKS